MDPLGKAGLSEKIHAARANIVSVQPPSARLKIRRESEKFTAAALYSRRAPRAR